MTYRDLDKLGRVWLSNNFYMREFLYSEVAHYYGLKNIPVNPELAIQTGSKLCTEILEPLQKKFGRIHVRSGYRSPSLNAFCHEKGLGCKKDNAARHTWDMLDKDGRAGAMACIVIPKYIPEYERARSYDFLKQWINENLPAEELIFFKMPCCFNIGWKLNSHTRT